MYVPVLLAELMDIIPFSTVTLVLSRDASRVPSGLDSKLQDRVPAVPGDAHVIGVVEVSQLKSSDTVEVKVARSESEMLLGTIIFLLLEG